MIMLNEDEYSELIGKASQVERLLAHNNVLRDNLSAVVSLKSSLEDDDDLGAGMVLSSFSEDVMNALWVAPTKGGIFTTKERQQIRRCMALPHDTEQQ